MKGLTRLLEISLALILAMLSVLVFLNVVLRYGFSTSILSTDEISRYLFVWLTFIGAILACAEKAHVSVDMLTKKLPRTPRLLLEIATQALMVFCCVLLLMGSYSLTVQNWSNAQPISGLPEGLLYAACLPASIGMGGILLWRLVLNIKALMQKNIDLTSEHTS